MARFLVAISGIYKPVVMKKLLIVLCVMIALLTSSCNRYYYKPNGVNVPLLTDGGQYHLNVNGSSSSFTDNGTTTSNMNVIDIQGSVSPIKHLGIMGGYSGYNYTTTTPDLAAGNVNARASLAEAGIGAYYALGGEKVKMVVDFYGGWGMGNINSDIDARVNRLFFQPGIGVRSPWFDASFSPRIVNLGFSSFNDKGRDSFYLRNQGLIDAGGVRFDSRRYTFFEPSFTIRAGYKFAKVQFQYVLSVPMSAMSWNISPGRFSVGFYLGIEDIIEMVREGNR